MKILHSWLLIAALCTFPVFEQDVKVEASTIEEIVPGFLLTERLELDGKILEKGATREQVLAALGRDYKVFQKPKRYTTDKLLAENELIESLAPGFPRMIQIGKDMALRCGTCWVEGISIQLGKMDVIRVSLMGPDRDNLALQFIAIDHDRAFIRRWRSQALKDASEGARYYVTDDGTWRVSMRNFAVKVERILPPSK